MQTGRPPKPIALKAIEGDTRKIGAIKHAESVSAAWNAQRGIPEMPEAFQPRPKASPETKRLLQTAREIWESLTPLMHEEGLLALIDSVAMATLCLAHAGAIEAMLAGDFRTADSLIAKTMQQADRMGLNESARARLQRPKEKQDDPTQSAMTEFLRNRNKTA